MENIFFESTKEIKKSKQELEKKLNVKIEIVGKKVSFEGDSVDEYEALTVLDAIKFGFPQGTALLLKNGEIIFKKISIRDYTRRKNLKDVKARVIGTMGTTKRTIEAISGCVLIIHNNEVGIIGHADDVEEATTALTNLIRGAKQANVYKFLEHLNRAQNEEGLGLKEKRSEKTSTKYRLR